MTNESYSVEIDRASQAEWDQAFQQFSDANIYQSWAYAAVRSRPHQVSRCVLRHGGEIVALAQLRIASPWRLARGLAYAQWGPLWRRPNRPENEEILRAMANALTDEYVRRRRLFLRIQAPTHQGTPAEEEFRRCFADFSASPFRSGQTYRTLVLDLGASLETIRKNFDSKWRNQLNRAEKNGLAVVQSDQPAAFETFAHLYRDMVARKGFTSSTNLTEYGKMQPLFRPEQKLQVFLASADGHPAAGAIISAHGDTGLYLFGATNDTGMKSKAAYLLQWNIISWLKAGGRSYYNLGGINPDINPGVFHFKNGISGRDTLYSLPMIRCNNSTSWAVVRFGEWLTPLARKITARKLV